MLRLASMAAASTAESHLVHKSRSGAIVTIVAAIMASWLLTSEIKGFMNPPLEQTVTVDQTRHDLLRLNFNISFLFTPCAAMHVDTVDISGEGASDSAADVGSDGGRRRGAGSPSPRDLFRARHSLRDGPSRTAVPSLGGGAASAAGGELHKYRLDQRGRPLEGYPEYVPPSAVHMSLGGFSFDAPPMVDGAELDAAFDAKEGCRVEGWLAAQRVAGTISFRPHLDDYLATKAAKSALAGQLAEQLLQAGAEGRGAAFLPHALRIDPDFSKMNVMHVVHELSFESGREGGCSGCEGGGNHHNHHGHRRRANKSPRAAAVAAARSGALGEDVQEAFPPDPLSGVIRGSPRHTGSWKYFAKVVPTTLSAEIVGRRAASEADAKIKSTERAGRSYDEGDDDGETVAAASSPNPSAFPLHAVHAYQYSITEKFTRLDRERPSIPTVSISYDMSPLSLQLSRPRAPPMHAAVRLVAVGGGIKALASFFGAAAHAVAGRRRHDGNERR